MKVMKVMKVQRYKMSIIKNIWNFFVDCANAYQQFRKEKINHSGWY